MKYIKSFHISIAFWGKKGFNKNSEAIQGFDPCLEVDIKIMGFFVIPNKIVIVLIDGDFKTENIFAHFITFIGDLKPVRSNDILENIFSEGMEIEDDYNQILNWKIDECNKKKKVKIEGEEFEGLSIWLIKIKFWRGEWNNIFFNIKITKLIIIHFFQNKFNY